jgi:hypothetical protein
MEAIMGGFFNGWKRKVGVLTLLMALLLMAGWVRSNLRFDQVTIDCVPHQIRVGAIDGMLFLLIATPEFDRPPAGPLFEWNSVKSSLASPNGVPLPYDPWRVYDVGWRWDWAGFHFGEGESPMQMMIREHLKSYFVPYWSIVIPLTLLSAYLLLTKPRQSTSDKIVEPGPEKVP